MNLKRSLYAVTQSKYINKRNNKYFNFTIMRTTIIIIASYFAILTMFAIGLTQPDLMASLGETHVNNYGDLNTLTAISLTAIPFVLTALTTVASYSWYQEAGASATKRVTAQS